MQVKNLFQKLSLLGILIIGLTMTSCGGSSSVDGNSISDAAGKLGDKTKGMAEGAKGAMNDAAGAMADGAKEMGDAAAGMADKAMEAGEGMANKAGAMADKAGEMADKAGAMADKAAGMKEKMMDKASGMKDKAAGMKDKMMDKASGMKDKAAGMKDKMMDKADGMKDKVMDKAKSATSQPVREKINKATSKPSEHKVMSKADVAKGKVLDKTAKVVTEATGAGVDHGAFDQLLSKHVSSTGVVNYAAFKGDVGKLDAYIANLSANPVSSSWSRDEKLAYWINAYNANTIKLILTNYPLAKITDLDGGKPWDRKWINLGGKTYSLNNIENDIIRPQFNEPRIHFAVNCAAKSCPPLLNQAWTASNLESNFTKTAKAFINNPTHNTISSSGATLSKIFEWYGGDFGDLTAFLNKYSNTKLNSGASIKFQDYNWALNGK